MFTPLTTLFAISIYTVLVFFIAWRFLGKWARVLFVVGTVLILAASTLFYIIPHTPWNSGELRALFDMRGEFNLIVRLTITIELLVTVTAFGLALFSRGYRWWHRLYWVLAGITFIYFAADEYYTFHERTGPGTLIALGASL
ncbi:hypothetical protein ACFLYO_11320, partial [Chloroflexota bacterium]